MNWPDAPNEFPLGDGRFASAAERPTDRSSLADCVLNHVSAGGAIYPQGGRTSLESGGIPDRPGIALDLTGLDRIVDYPAADMTITVEAGVTLAALRRVLDAEGQRLPLDAPSPDRATIGGIYATDTSGPSRFGFGRPRDQIIGISFVSSQGKVIKGGGRVVKNVAGYDFPKLLTGSMGSLGSIVELTLKTRPKPEAMALFWARWDGWDRIDSVLSALNTSQSRPIAIDLLNAPAAEEIARASGLDLPCSGPVLVLAVEGAPDVVSWQLGVLGEELSGASDRVEVREADADRLLAGLTEHPAAGSAMNFKASMVPSQVAAFVAEVDPGRWAVQSHGGNGIVWGRARAGVEVSELSSDILRHRESAIGADGNLTLPRCPTELKAELGVWGAPGGDWELVRMIKRSLDPAGAMNPGRLL